MKAEVEMRNEVLSQQWHGPPELLQAGKKAWNEFSLRKPGEPNPDDSLISDLLSFHTERHFLLLWVLVFIAVHYDSSEND